MSGILPVNLHGAIAEILAGRKAAPGAGQHQHARWRRRPRVLDRVERHAQFGVHRVGEAVQLVGAVQGQAGDAVATSRVMFSKFMIGSQA
jgi:hypothetical protein